jgi:peptide/nickel transport system permease protein
LKGWTACLSCLAAARVKVPHLRLRMLEYLARRLAISALVLGLVSLAVFGGLRALPGDPARVLAGTEADDTGLQEIRERYGLDRPIPVQYLSWIGQVAQGHLGESIRTREPVVRTVGIKLPITLELAGLALLVAAGIGIPMGILSAIRRNSFWDWVANGLSLTGTSIPNFWFGILLILVFAVSLHWLPASGYAPPFEQPIENLVRMIMPAIVLGTALSAFLMRQTRNSMLEVLAQDYIRTARAKGVSGRTVLIRHALRNSLLPVITILGLQAGDLISGAVVTEQIFVIPGFGRLILEAVFNRDYPMVQGVVLITCTGYVGINLLVDFAYSWANPRIRVQGGSNG